MRATDLFRLTHVVIGLLAVVVVIAEGGEDVKVKPKDVPMTLTFVNEMPNTPIEVFWENHVAGERKAEGTIPPRGGHIDVNTYVGHEFSYDLDGKRHYVSTQRANALGQQYTILTGDKDAILVRCELQGTVGDDTDLYSPHLEINVKPYWAPRGASRFLELVRNKYYDGVAFNRVVPKFLTQFGIAKDYETRTEWESRPILDDFREMRFEPGYIAFAGNGPDSRTTEIFIVMPGTEKEQLEYFGTNSWEAPFAVISNPEKSVLRNFYSGYGDMPPWGQGPDSEKIYDVDGYEYLAKNFPKLDYIERCYIVEEELADEIAVEL